MIEVFIMAMVLVQTKAAPFPQHMDLQKVGEVMFDAEKYNVLKPTVHTVADHFAHIVRRGSDEIPSKRLFIDHNGFRHHWTGFDDEENDGDNLRKCEHDNIISQSTDTKNETADVTEKVEDGREKTAVVTSDKEVEPEAMTEQATSEKNGVTNNTESESTKAESEILRAGPKKKLRRRRKKKALRAAKERTIAHTTLFCPFFGIITMHRYID